MPVLHRPTRRDPTSWSRTPSTRSSSSSTSPSPSSTCSTPSAGAHRTQSPWRRGRKTCRWSPRRSLPQVRMEMINMEVTFSSAGEESESGGEKKEAVWSNIFSSFIVCPVIWSFAIIWSLSHSVLIVWSISWSFGRFNRMKSWWQKSKITSKETDLKVLLLLAANHR